MRNNQLFMKVAGISMAAALSCSVLVGCGGGAATTTTNDDAASEAQSSVVDAATSDTASSDEEEWNAEEGLAGLLEANPAEDNYLVLSGIGGGWAPAVLVLDNDGNFTALVDYAGQATVSFAAGTYTENEDGSITCEGSLYNTGDDVTYEIAVADGTYTTSVEIPDAGCSADLTGSIA